MSVYLANKTLDLLRVEGVWWGTHPKEAIEGKKRSNKTLGKKKKKIAPKRTISYSICR